MRAIARGALLVATLAGLLAGFGRLGQVPTAVFLTLSVTQAEEHWIRHFAATPRFVAGPQGVAPSILPGPLDAWAGSRRAVLAIPIRATDERDLALRLELHDAHEAAPPLLVVRVDGEEVASLRVQAGRGRPPPHDVTGRPATYRVRLPAEAFARGSSHEIELETRDGSWIAPRRIQIESWATRFDPYLVAHESFVGPDKLGPLGVLAAALVVFGLALRPDLDPRGRFVLAMGIAFLGYVALDHRLEGRSELVGDEPWYVLTAHSLVNDGDADIADEIAEAVHRTFYQGGFTPQQGDRDFVVAGVPHYYSGHDLGVPLAIAPAYAAAGLPGVMLFLNLLFAAAAGGVFAWLRAEGHSFPGSLFTTVSIAFSAPVVFYSCQVYPDSLAMPLVLAAAVLVLRGDVGRAGSAALLLALLVPLPLLHLRFALPAGALAVFGLVRASFSRGGAVLALAALGAFALAGATLALHGAPVDRLAVLSLETGATSGWWGILFDVQFGLFTYAPFYATAAAGFVPLVRRDRFGAALVAAVVIPYGLVVGASEGWPGGASPPGRFLTPVVPLLALPLAELIRAAPSRRWLVPSFVLASASVAFGVWLMRVPHHQWVKTAWVDDANARFGGNLFDVLPDFWNAPEASYRVAMLWSLPIVIWTGLYAWRTLRDR